MPEDKQIIEAMLPPGKAAFTEKELADIFDIRVGQFQEWRCNKNGGPSFVKLGRRFIRYPRKEVIKWGVATVIAN